MRVALLGNPNTGKTTLFNRLSGLRHKTSNFPGTTQEARIGFVGKPSAGADVGGAPLELIDLPGVYSLELEQSESQICRDVLAGTLAPRGEVIAPPDAACVVLDGTNLARNLLLAGEMLRRRLPTVVAINMIDLVRKRGLSIDTCAIEERLGCEAVLLSARTGEGIEALRAAIPRARIPNRTPPGTREGLESWADDVYAHAIRHEKKAAPGGAGAPSPGSSTLTDRLDHVFTHPVLGLATFAVVMTALFYSIFSLAQLPMNALDALFTFLAGIIERTMPDGLVRDFLTNGVVAGIAATVVFLPQICLLFFLISLLEDTGYLSRAAFLMDRLLRPFGLPGHSFVPLLSSHACALPGIMACRGIPDRRQRLATILVAPFMTCSARLPVYVLVTSVLFAGRPLLAALAFVGCYALGMTAGVLSALAARRTLLRGPSRPMALELPTYKLPSLRSALLAMYDRGLVFLTKAGTNILAICIVLWWLGEFPRVAPPPRAVELRQMALDNQPDAASVIDGKTYAIDDLLQEADRLEASNAKAHSFIGRLGRTVQPVFSPLGYDWQLTVGVLTSFAAREVFVSTMAVIVTGNDDAEAEGVLDQIAAAERTDGSGRVFTTATAWSILVFFILAMQCLPTLAVTTREAGGVKWALLQFAWMSGIAYLAALITYQSLRSVGVA